MGHLPPLSQLSRIAGSFAANRIAWSSPLILLHAVTEACNARCPYCVFHHGRRRPDELSLSEIDALYAEAAAIGVRYVHVWGGEPLVHPHIGEVFASARRAGLITGMVTNGMFLAKRADEVLPNLDRLFVSVDHPSDKHSAMRRTPRLFENLIAGVRLVRQRSPNLYVAFNLTLCRDNQDAIGDAVALCRELGVRLYVAPMRVDPNSPEGVEANAARVVPWDEQRPIWSQLLALKDAGAPVLNSRHYLRMLARGGPPVYRCHWPKLALGIEANGDLTDCQDWAHPVGNVRDGLLSQLLWHPRLCALRGAAGEGCSQCSVPARVEPSRFWGLRPELVLDAIGGLVR